MHHNLPQRPHSCFSSLHSFSVSVLKTSFQSNLNSDHFNSTASFLRLILTYGTLFIELGHQTSHPDSPVPVPVPPVILVKMLIENHKEFGVSYTASLWLYWTESSVKREKVGSATIFGPFSKPETFPASLLATFGLIFAPLLF